MRTERREQQSLNLLTAPPSFSRERPREQKEAYQTYMLPDRWTRVSLNTQKKNFVFENLRSLEKMIKRSFYRPQAKKEVLIPKANGKTRLIAISCFEDKIVDRLIGKIVTTIYEPLSIRTSFGYRPKRSADDAIKTCYNSLMDNKRKHVVEIDFSSFFNTIPHRKLMKVRGGRQNKRKVLKVGAQKEKLLRAIRELEIWIKENRSKMKLKVIWALAKSKVMGHINYYGYACNKFKIKHFYIEVVKSLFKWLNRVSQKRLYSLEGFN